MLPANRVSVSLISRLCFCYKSVIVFIRYDELLEELSTLFGAQLAGENLQATEKVIGDLDRLARRLQGVAARQIPVKGILSRT